MFRGVKIIDFNLSRSRIAVKDKEGKVIEVDLSY
jgi:hypothetical protein